MAYFKQFNRWTSPYKNAHPGDDGPMVFSSNCEEAFTVRQLKQDSRDCEYTWLPSKREGDRDGLLVEWYAPLGIWTVWEFNPNAPHLRRYQVRWDARERLYLVVDAENSDRRAGSAPTEYGANAIARNLNKQAV